MPKDSKPKARSLLDCLNETPKQKRKGPQCAVCALPADERKLIHEYRANGWAYRALSDALSSAGRTMSLHPVQTHFQDGHHLREASGGR